MGFFMPLDVQPVQYRRRAWACFVLLILVFASFLAAILVSVLLRAQTLPTSLSIGKSGVRFPGITTCHRITYSPADWETFLTETDVRFRCIQDYDGYSPPTPKTIKAYFRNGTAVPSDKFVVRSSAGVPTGAYVKPATWTGGDNSLCLYADFEGIVGQAGETAYSAPRFCSLDIFSSIGITSFMRFLASYENGTKVLGETGYSYYSTAEKANGSFWSQLTMRLDLTTTKYINGTRETVASWIREDAWPSSPGRSGSMSLVVLLDSRGETLITQIWPVSHTSIISQVLAAWASIALAFGLLFPMKDERYYVFDAERRSRSLASSAESGSDGKDSVPDLYT
ncbi:hypothetical protein KFL_003130010 [Klebsormidium nitens]|uniref:Uncharacterized protein n=1 Tax=Klebsormidium nitens TaxID=105231 RepID=A0A1Y1I8F4_KLENI|nr:hypothetical protein KFL_003130010 [Klebsormidium nitens]|eukprot:GAQ86813.1 hypothetical protein KFL_003130010 [Klebsormidium nitens]